MFSLFLQERSQKEQLNNKRIIYNAGPKHAKAKKQQPILGYVECNKYVIINMHLFGMYFIRIKYRIVSILITAFIDHFLRGLMKMPQLNQSHLYCACAQRSPRFSLLWLPGYRSASAACVFEGCMSFIRKFVFRSSEKIIAILIVKQ